MLNDPQDRPEKVWTGEIHYDVKLIGIMRISKKAEVRNLEEASDIVKVSVEDKWRKIALREFMEFERVVILSNDPDQNPFEPEEK